MDSGGENWAEIVADVERGDRRALFKLSRFVASLLRRMRARDFQDDWSDITQDVIIDVVLTRRKDRVSDPSDVRGLIVTVTRRRFMDRLRAYYRREEGQNRRD